MFKFVLRSCVLLQVKFQYTATSSDNRYSLDKGDVVTVLSNGQNFVLPEKFRSICTTLSARTKACCLFCIEGSSAPARYK